MLPKYSTIPKTFFSFLSELHQILSPLVDDRQPTYLTKFEKQKQNS
jgi:hypothetical protein